MSVLIGIGDGGTGVDETAAAPPCRYDVDYQVDGIRISGWLYFPESTGKPFPCVVLDAVCGSRMGSSHLRLPPLRRERG